MADCRLGHRARASRPGADGGRGRWWRTRRGPRAGATGAPRRGSFEAAPMKRASPSRACSHGAEPPPADYPASARTARNCTPSERPRASPLPDILKVPEQPASAAVDDGTGRHRGLLPRRRCSRLRRRGGTMVRPPAQAEGVALVGTPANLEAVAANLDGGPFFAFLGGALIGFDAAYPELHLGGYLNAADRAPSASLPKMCRPNGSSPTPPRSRTARGAASIPPPPGGARPRREQRRQAGAVGAGAPVPRPWRVAPYSVEVALHRRWRALGARSDLVSFPGDRWRQGSRPRPPSSSGSPAACRR